MRYPAYALAAILTLSSSVLVDAQPASPPQAAAAASAKAAPAYESDPKFITALAEAKKQLHNHQYDFALDAFKKANKVAGGACVTCLDNIYEIQSALGKYKDAAASAQQLGAIASNPRDKSSAEARRGQALLQQAGDKGKPADLQAAHAVLQEALADYPKNLFARYTDGCVLARLGNTDDAAKAFTACADAASPTDPMRVRARHFAENPALSLSKMAPAFQVTALDGSHFNLDEMGGRVVLIDFWATWCGPCNEELPHLKKIAAEFAGQPLVIISISWDADEAKWKDFIAKHEMTWIQYRDADHNLSNRFGVNAIPHYFTIDSDGVLTAEMLGSGSDVEGKLKKLLKRARDSKSATTVIAGTH